MNDLYGVFWTDDECGCTGLTALFSSEPLARAHALVLGEEMRRIEILSAQPERAVLFHAIYYSWHAPLGSTDDAWSYEDDYAELCEKLKNIPAPDYWENWADDWTLITYGKTRQEAEAALDAAVSVRLNKQWTFAGAGGKWLR